MPPWFSQGVALLGAQLLGWILAIALQPIMPSLAEAQLLLQGSFAAMAGRLLKLPYGWVPFNLILPWLVATAVDSLV